jgi:hypothetical protein
MGQKRRTAAAAFAGALFLLAGTEGSAQIVAEPAFLTAGVPDSEVFLPYLAFPENSYVIGGMLRFPVGSDVDIGGRAGLWLIDDSKDTPYAGADLRYELFSRQLDPGGGQLALSFDVGLGVSDPNVTVWKVPLGFIAGIGFKLAGGDSEIFANPRVELGMSSGDDDFDSALLLDLGGLFTIKPPMGVMLSIRFGQGVFLEGDKAVLGIGVGWRL